MALVTRLFHRHAYTQKRFRFTYPYVYAMAGMGVPKPSAIIKVELCDCGKQRETKV
jgi:hypothetical protein